MNIYKIYDNGGTTMDRFTVLTESYHFGKSCEALSLSENPESPQGFSQFGEAFDGEHLGKEINFEDLPDNVREHIIKRLKINE